MQGEIHQIVILERSMEDSEGDLSESESEQSKESEESPIEDAKQGSEEHANDG